MSSAPPHRARRWEGAALALLGCVLGALIIVLQYRLWLAPEGGFIELTALDEALRAQQADNAALEERNRSLEAEVRDLKEGLEAIEERARVELGMIRAEETFYRLLEEPPASSGRGVAR